MDKLIEFNTLDMIKTEKGDSIFDEKHGIKLIYSCENDIQLKMGNRNEWLSKDEIYITSYRGKIKIDSPFSSQYSIFYLKLKSRAEERFLNRHFNIRPSQKLILNGIIAEYEILTTNPSSEISGLMLKSLFEQFFLTVFRENLRLERVRKKNRAEEETVKFVISYLEEHIGEEIRFAEIVKKAGLSSTGLKNLFKSYTGMGVMQYYSCLKIKKAKELLAEGELNVTQIANILGYESIHYFSRQFKSIEGISPTAYKNRL